MFDDASFDVVLQIDTLQHLRATLRPVARETARIGRIGIVAFPNFGRGQPRAQRAGDAGDAPSALRSENRATRRTSACGTGTDFQVLSRCATA